MIRAHSEAIPVDDSGRKTANQILGSLMINKRLAVLLRLGQAEYLRQSLEVRRIIKELMAEYNLPATIVAMALVEAADEVGGDKDLILAALVDEIASTPPPEVV